MEHQFRRGIYRPNAQRLSISLEPMVAQRSLMFRVKTDLATKTSYAEMTITDESPALYTLSGSAVLTAISAISTSMSSASMYSQESWKTPSPSVSVFVVEVDTAISTSPTETAVQLSHLEEEEEEDSDWGFTSKSPSVFTLPQDVLFPMVKEDNDTVSHSKSDVVVLSSLTNNAVRNSVRSLVDVGSLRTLRKRFSKIKSRSNKLSPNKQSGSSKAIRKVMNRLSFLPSNRELAQL